MVDRRIAAELRWHMGVYFLGLVTGVAVSELKQLAHFIVFARREVAPAIRVEELVAVAKRRNFGMRGSRDERREVLAGDRGDLAAGCGKLML